eukprot:6492172-Amphidinium_carterae.1
MDKWLEELSSEAFEGVANIPQKRSAEAEEPSQSQSSKVPRKMCAKSWKEIFDAEFGDLVANLSKEVEVVTTCSGMDTPVFALEEPATSPRNFQVACEQDSSLQEMGVKYRNVVSCDCKAAAVKWLSGMSSQMQAEHHVMQLSELGSGLESPDRCVPCSRHTGTCKLALQCDMYISGFPCAPYSCQRASRYTEEGDWTRHAQVHTMIEALRIARLSGARCGLLENVEGLTEAVNGKPAPLTYITNTMASYGYSCGFVHADLAHFVTAKRRRTPIVLRFAGVT